MIKRTRSRVGWYETTVGGDAGYLREISRWGDRGDLASMDQAVKCEPDWEVGWEGVRNCAFVLDRENCIRLKSYVAAID